MRVRRSLICLLILTAVLLGCVMPAGLSFSSQEGQAQETPRPTYILEVPGATPTPTPFQPIAPTPVIWPANQPSPTPKEPGLATPTPPPPTPSASDEQAIPQPTGQINILLLGSDRRPWTSGFRTDTIILVTLNSELGRVNVTSFPRDLWVTIPGWGMGRINTAWVYGGYKLLSQTFKSNFGIRPDFYALIDFSSFKKIVDGLGGLDINVAQTVSDYRAGYWTTIPKGMVHMDADTVLWYVRTRKTTNDMARNRRQQEALQSIFEKLLSMDGLKRAPEFFQLYKDSVTSDITLVDVLTWLPLAAKIAETRELHHYYIGYGQVYDWISPEGAMVLVPNQGSLMDVVRKSQNTQ
jgi:LCP family protein required for cell wall assembly